MTGSYENEGRRGKNWDPFGLGDNYGMGDFVGQNMIVIEPSMLPALSVLTTILAVFGVESYVLYVNQSALASPWLIRFALSYLGLRGDEMIFLIPLPSGTRYDGLGGMFGPSGYRGFDDGYGGYGRNRS